MRTSAVRVSGSRLGAMKLTVPSKERSGSALTETAARAPRVHPPRSRPRNFPPTHALDGYPAPADSHGLVPAVDPRRTDGHRGLVELDGPDGADFMTERAPRGRCGANARPLNLLRIDGDRAGRLRDLALVDRNVVHS